jgi:ATP-dependent Clp protease ATP-binding subunit ClpA
MGFHLQKTDSADSGHDLSNRMSRAGVAAARRKFTPEFVNRLDRIVVFKPLGHEELRSIVDIELGMVQDRIRVALDDGSMVLNVSESARELLLAEGTDSRYGARHLKRAIERLVVQPLSNLLATAQIHRGDTIRITNRAGSSTLTFFREASEADVRVFAAPLAA